MKGKVWSKQYLKNGKLTVGFLNDGLGKNKPEWTPITILNNATSTSGKKLEMDPLELVFRDAKIQPIPAVKQVILERLQPIVGFTYDIDTTPNPNSQAHIRINFDSTQGCYSLVGIDSVQEGAPRTSLNYGWLDVGTIIHELCHSIGMLHEHQNPFGNQIEWNKQAVYDWASSTQGWDKQMTDVNILDKYSITQLNGSMYDPESVMLYFYPSSLTLNHKATEMNLRLSATDVAWISMMYPGGQDPEKFYKKVYNSPYHPYGIGKSNHLFLWMTILFIFCVLISIITYVITKSK
jgi:hypothetical protein